MNNQYSVILGFLGQLRDRFATYHDPQDLEGKLALASQIEGIKGVEAVYPFDYQGMTPDTYKALLAKYNLQISSVNVNIKAEAKFHQGALTSIDSAKGRAWSVPSSKSAALASSECVSSRSSSSLRAAS